MENKWTISPYFDTEIEQFEDIHPLIQRILRIRGISNKEDMLDFLSEKPQKTYDPFLMRNMEEATEAILRAIAQKKNIWIYGDYDVDGLTSVCVMMEFINNLTEKCFYYIPSRFEEGYGLNKDALKHIKDSGADLVITVDCGTTSVEEVKYAKEIGLEVIVTDHHNLGEEIPDCLLINPKQKDCQYPYKDICGCGVAFKLVQALQKKTELPKNILLKLLDLVAIATVADIVPLVDENRIFVKYGLYAINDRRRKGLAGLLEGIGLKDKIVNSYHIAFVIAPHLNAGGRIHSAEAGVNLFLSNNDTEINRLTRMLIEFNRERKNLQDEGVKKCSQIVDENHPEDLFLVIDSNDIHEGVTGIIAGKIKDKYYRPTIIVTKSKEEGILKGTGRSIVNIDLYHALKRYENYFIKFGGHAGACGFSMEASKLDELRSLLNEEAKTIKDQNPDYFIKEIYIASELDTTFLTHDFIETLNKLEPFGHKNEKPLFLLKNLTILNEFYMGAQKEHLKLRCSDESGQYFDAIAFNMKAYYKNISITNKKIDLVGFPEINEYNGIRKIQFQVIDMKKSNW